MGKKAKVKATRENNKGSSNGSTSGSGQQSARSIPRVDGNRDPSVSTRKAIDYANPKDIKNLADGFGVMGTAVARGTSSNLHGLPQRPPKFNTSGREIQLTLNSFKVVKPPTKMIYQYELHFNGDAQDYTKKALLKKIWGSQGVTTALGQPGNHFIWDGNKLAWSDHKMSRDETRITVDLDQEEGRPTKPGQRGNKHTMFIRQTGKVDIEHLQLFLNGAEWSNKCIDAINFLDHLLREHPSQRMTAIKKSFFQRGEKRFDLGNGVEAFKGVFASLRPVLFDTAFNKGMAINVDVANGTFWRPQILTQSVLQAFNCGLPQLQQRFNEAKQDWSKSRMKQDFKRFKRVGVTTTHMKKENMQYTIDEFVGKDATEHTFSDPDDRSKRITVAQYFKKKYGVVVTPKVPLVKMTKKMGFITDSKGNKVTDREGKPKKDSVYVPMDVLKIDDNQRYNTKLSDTQTSQMIRFAVTLPAQRWEAIQNGVRLLNWGADPYLNHYGLQVTTNATKVKAQILPSPAVQFGAGSKEANVKPQDLVNGRWRLDGRKFAMNNKERPIKAWGVCVIQGRGSPPQDAVSNFMRSFVQIYESHGGQISAHPQHGKTPYMCPGNLADGGELVSKFWTATGNRYQSPPSLLIFIVNDRNIDVYRRIKKSCDIRFGIASQVMQAKHVMAAQGQYISNVCMKVNAKLGGATCVTKSSLIPRINPKATSIPTMIVGADVSHPAPGAGELASFAAITVSQDPFFVRYWAEVQTNGHRIEMITENTINEHFGNMAKKWIQRLGKGKAPERVLYIRDGVADGQYAAVLEEEVKDMKACFSKLGCTSVPKFTVVIAGKRHHTRFFPDKGDRNNNPIPGTLVEAGCTHPFEFDFYLCSHVAIKGTARPIHYHCILNEGEYSNTELEQTIFEHSYQYMRSTTPVSLHPAVYYAHLAADRARAHLNDNPVSSGKKQSPDEATSSTGSSKAGVEVAPLLAMPNTRGLQDVMWYI